MEGTSNGSAAEKEAGRVMERGKARVPAARAPWESVGAGARSSGPGVTKPGLVRLRAASCWMYILEPVS